MSIPEFQEIIEPNDQTEARREHLDAMRDLVGNVYPNKFERSRLTGSDDTITHLIGWRPVVNAAREMADLKATLTEGERPPADFKDALNERLKALGTIRTAGRVTTPPRGNFAHLTDGRNKLQIYCDKRGGFALVKNDGEGTIDPTGGWTAWKLVDHGDIVGVEGYLFVTNTGEVSVHVEKLQFLAKAMLPMPDKMHGIADAEIRQRQRYYDLIGSSLAVEHEGLSTREVFERRARLVSSLRRFLEDHGYIEVETPMLTPKATGAAAKPFETHHNALDITLYARIAPELYLKRLVVGGFEKVYELNRNFRNEGISYKHNPEFTMLEFYCAYMDVGGMMDFCEHMLQEAIRTATGGLTLEYEGNEIDFSAFERLPMTEAIIRHLPYYCDGRAIGPDYLDDPANVQILRWFLSEVESQTDVQRGVKRVASGERDAFQREYLGTTEFLEGAWKSAHTRPPAKIGTDQNRTGLLITSLFEEFAEPKLTQPTFIIDYPKSISPLSKADPSRPQVAERFELFINGMEVANGFSELNDPREQYERFVDQMQARERGDEEAMVLDEDYIRALSYGMPPAAGIGVGIDRLTMLLTNKHSIRDVILFPHMRPEKKKPTDDGAGDE